MTFSRKSKTENCFNWSRVSCPLIVRMQTVNHSELCKKRFKFLECKHIINMCIGQLPFDLLALVLSLLILLYSAEHKRGFIGDRAQS